VLDLQGPGSASCRCPDCWLTVHSCRTACPNPFQVVYDEAGVAVGVRSEGETAKAKLVVGDPTYFREKVGY